MVGAEGTDETGYGLGPEGVQEAEGHLAGRRIGVLLYGFGGAADLREGLLGRGQEGAAGRGEGDRAALAGEQRDAQVLFEPDHGAGQGGLRDAQLVGGAGDVLVAGDGDEMGQPRREQCCHGHVFYVTVHRHPRL